MVWELRCSTTAVLFFPIFLTCFKQSKLPQQQDGALKREKKKPNTQTPKDPLAFILIVRIRTAIVDSPLSKCS